MKISYAGCGFGDKNQGLVRLLSFLKQKCLMKTVYRIRELIKEVDKQMHLLVLEWLRPLLIQQEILASISSMVFIPPSAIT